MADVTTELMFEVLKQIQSDISALKEGQREQNAALGAIRTHLGGLQQDVTNLYAIFARFEIRLERVERRLEIVEVPA